MHWPDFDQQLWDEVTTEALEKQTEFEYQILASDISPKNLASARANVKSARLHKDVKLSVSPFSEVKRPAGDSGLIIINPPYGERIRLNDIIGLYKSIGNTLKQEFAGYHAWIISSDQRALGFIGLRPSAKLTVFNGPLECKYEHFDLYKGSKRGRYMDENYSGPEKSTGTRMRFGGGKTTSAPSSLGIMRTFAPPKRKSRFKVSCSTEGRA